MKRTVKQQLGVTLIELIIAMLIMVILASIAYPSYTQHVAKGYRADALAEMMRVMNLQEQYYLDHRQFTTDMTQLGFNTSPYRIESGFYDIKTALDSTGEYIITATAIGTQLARDASCSPLTLNSNGDKNKPECW